MPHRQAVANLDEAAIKSRLRAKGAETVEAATTLALAKAERLSAQHPEALVIGADQILDLEGTWFDKPTNETAAAETLARLAGKTHHLVTATCLLQNESCVWRHVETAKLTMRSLTSDHIEHYLAEAGPETLESVGAYRLEGIGIRLFERIDGDYFTILGLPLLPLLEALRRRGVIDEEGVINDTGGTDGG